MIPGPLNKKPLSGKFLLLLVTSLVVTNVASFSTLAQILEDSVQSHTYPQSISLQSKQVTFNGNNGEYEAEIVITGSQETIWSVLRDYDRYEEFMPNVVESRLLENEGNFKIFEQVQIFNILGFNIRGHVKLAVTENYPQGLTFELVEGDVTSLSGSWMIENMSPNEFLLTHQVSVMPSNESSFTRNLFFSVYEQTLKETLVAVKNEVEQRSDGF